MKNVRTIFYSIVVLLYVKNAFVIMLKPQRGVKFVMNDLTTTKCFMFCIFLAK